MERKYLVFSGLLTFSSLGLIGCAPNAGQSLEIACTDNKNLEKATKTIDLAVGQIVYFGGKSFEVEAPGKLRVHRDRLHFPSEELTPEGLLLDKKYTLDIKSVEGQVTRAEIGLKCSR